MLSRLANLIPTEDEVALLNNIGRYHESYHKCELFLIYYANGMEWYDDNKWWKDSETNVKKPSLYLMFLFSVAAYYTNNYHRAFHIQQKLLNTSFTDSDNVLCRLKSNISFSIEKVKGRLSFYPEDIVYKLMEPREMKGLVTLTMTTCKRLDLFIRTMNSFLNACKDILMIDRFLIVDDNSSKEDRETMKSMYPFIELYEKSPSEIGHPTSLNIILDNINTAYALHLEDDHEFFCHRNYIKPSIRIMEEKENIGQVLFNENYIEIAHDICVVGGLQLERDSKGNKYYIHIYYPRGSKEYTDFFATLKPGTLTNTHWPHYSLRPSLTRCKAWKDSGKFNMEVEFERKYAERYVKTGYRSAFLLGMHHIHIGRTSHELNAGLNIENAYTLNNTRQWGY